MPKYNISPRERKLFQLQQLNDINNQAAMSDLNQAAALTQQLQQLYNIGEQAGTADARAEGMALQNEGQALQNDAARFQQQWQQPMAEMQYARGMEDVAGGQARRAGEITPADYISYYERMGLPLPTEFQPPGVRAESERAAAEKQKLRDAETARMQAAEATPAKSPSMPLMEQFARFPYDAPAAAYNTLIQKPLSYLGLDLPVGEGLSRHLPTGESILEFIKQLIGKTPEEQAALPPAPSNPSRLDWLNPAYK